ncbi:MULTISPECIES: TetR/AcrR family transcriptional regulator [Fredinandcohnia]|uniref:TetR/AcrR family transcriptional regulator n=1 Tax=Fredinandcohnia salidurans TaxID=2595041 RepID=A0ABW4MI22_9BACI|nr:TetR/AcrR family transcriptional regulator [Fredinandcohnia onubensis]
MLFVTEMPIEAREKLLFAGLKLFTELGYQKTSVLEIVEMARVSKTTFYQHFKSKEDIMVALFEQLGNEMSEEVKLAISLEESMSYKAFAGINRYIQICFENKNVAQILLVESVGVSRNVELVRQRSHQVFASIILQTVQTELPKTVSKTEMRIVAQAMVGAINEVIMQNFFNNEDETFDFEGISRLLNRIVISAFVNLGMQE